MRGIGFDGSIDIRCSDCGEVICRQPYSGFSTALCLKCQRRRDVLAEELKKQQEKMQKEQKHA